MSQQTINIGASPNDGTGTPLRTAFDFTNLNFTELYTAVGPSGNNIVVPGNATITGDLTVDTNVLKVDTTNNRVGIGTASPAAGYSLDILGAAVGGVRVSANNYPGLTVDSANLNGVMIYLQEGGVTQARIGHLTSLTGLEFSGNNGAFATNVHYGIDATGISTWKNVGGVAGTAMTLSSIGLGIGASPTEKLSVNGAIGFQYAASQKWHIYATSSSDLVFTRSTIADRFTITSDGNVGIGVAPSATDSTYYQALEIARVGQGLTCVKSAFTGTPNSWLSNNSYATYSAGTVWKYAVSGQSAAQYRLAGGEHQWLNAPSGTAGNPITGANAFVQAMTLDASGNLLVAETSAYIRAGGRTQIVGGSVVDINIAGNNVGIAFGGGSSILPCDGSSVTTDGVVNFGSASKRWNTIYASTGTINTSDQNEKQDIADLGDAEKRVAGKIKSLVKKYRFKDAVASKGENARIHVGWIAQDIQNAFSSEGLDASKYGVFCSDTWEENGVQKTRLGLRYDEVLAFVVSAI